MTCLHVAIYYNHLFCHQSECDNYNLCTLTNRNPFIFASLFLQKHCPIILPMTYLYSLEKFNPNAAIPKNSFKKIIFWFHSHFKDNLTQKRKTRSSINFNITPLEIIIIVKNRYKIKNIFSQNIFQCVHKHEKLYMLNRSLNVLEGNS